MSNFQKNSKDYGEPDITYQLAGAAEQRPFGIPMGDACSAKNLDGIQTTSISGIGNETGRFYLGFQEDFESCDQNDLGLQESGQETDAAGTDCNNLHFHRPRCSPFFLESDASHAELYD